jgi:hypothetical protein
MTSPVNKTAGCTICRRSCKIKCFGAVHASICTPCITHLFGSETSLAQAMANMVADYGIDGAKANGWVTEVTTEMGVA